MGRIQLQASKRRVCADILIKGLEQVTALGDTPIRGGCPARGEGWGAAVLPNSSLQGWPQEEVSPCCGALPGADEEEPRLQGARRSATPSPAKRCREGARCWSRGEGRGGEALASSLLLSLPSSSLASGEGEL